MKDDGTIEDASTFIITRVTARPDSTAIDVRLSGAVDTSTLDPKFQVAVILANSTFTKVTHRHGAPWWCTRVAVL